MEIKNLNKEQARLFFESLLKIDPKKETDKLQEAFNAIGGLHVDVFENRDEADKFILDQVNTWSLSEEVLPLETLKTILKNFAPQSWIQNHSDVSNRLSGESDQKKKFAFLSMVQSIWTKE